MTWTPQRQHNLEDAMTSFAAQVPRRQIPTLRDWRSTVLRLGESTSMNEHRVVALAALSVQLQAVRLELRASRQNLAEQEAAYQRRVNAIAGQVAAWLIQHEISRKNRRSDRLELRHELVRLLYDFLPNEAHFVQTKQP